MTAADVRTALIAEVDGLMDSLDEHVSPEDMHGALRELRKMLTDSLVAESDPLPTDSREAPSPMEWERQMQAERERQITVYGYDDAHDREHGIPHLLNWAIDYARRGKNLEVATVVRSALNLVRSTERADLEQIKRAAAAQALREFARDYSGGPDDAGYLADVANARADRIERGES